MSKIFQPLTLRSVTIPNRIGMPPMCQYSAKDGFANDWHFVHYSTRSVGGVGLIIVEATSVVPEGRITPFDLGIWNDEHIPALKRITDKIVADGSIPGIQIAHAGRKASHDKPVNGSKQLQTGKGGWLTVGPSPLVFEDGETLPLELSIAQIREICEKFADAAIRSLKAGFKVLEIHAAHGYLLQEFLSPLSNKRTDEYGGSFENRIRFLIETTRVVRSVWPAELPLLVRLSATEWTDGGWTPEETVKLAAILKSEGVDMIDCSSGGNVLNAPIPLSPGYQVHLAKKVKESGIAAAAVGLITTEAQIREILESDQADLVLIGRELLRNPYFVLSFQESPWPDQYLRSRK